MAQMNQMQKKFAKTFETELASMDTSENTSTQHSDQNLAQKSGKNHNCKALGPNRMIAEIDYKPYTCILCQEDDNAEKNTLVYATYIGKIRSSLWKFLREINFFIFFSQFYCVKSRTAN